MTNEKVQQIIRNQWDRQGFCNSCGYHGSFDADYFPDSYYINEEKQRIELSCASGEDSHRGVHIYYKNMIENKEKGLFGKYKIKKSNGEAVDEQAKYFVLRYDHFGDYCHVKASKKALRAYAEAIQEDIPQLAEDLKKELKIE